MQGRQSRPAEPRPANETPAGRRAGLVTVNSLLLINDNSAHQNWGAQATAFALKRLFEREFVGYQLQWLPWEWLRRTYRRVPGFGGRLVLDVSRVRRSRSVVNVLTRDTEFFPSVADDFEYFGREWLAGRGGPFASDFTPKATRAAAVVYNAENSIYFNTLEGCRGIFLLWYAKAVLKRPAFVINQTADLTTVWPIMNAMVQRTYPLLDGVTAREVRSLGTLRALGITQADFVPDVVFSLDPADFARHRVEEWLRERELDRRPYFCLSTSGLPVSWPRPGDEGGVALLVRQLRNLGLEGVLLAKDGHCQPLRGVAALTGSHFFGPENEFSDLWPLLERAAVLVTGHFHYAIFAAMAGCPFVPLTTNNHKMNGLCEALGLTSDGPYNATDLTASAGMILRDTKRLWEERAPRSSLLRTRAQDFREAAAEHARMVWRCVARERAS